MKIAFDIIQNISVIIASIVAILGISSWRKEMKWKRKYELAEEVLSLFYEAKEKIAIIRNTFSHNSEGESRKRADTETTRETEILNRAYVFFERYEKQKETFSKLKAMKFRFMAIYGKESGDNFDEINRIINTILLAANRLGTMYWQNQGYKQFRENEFEIHLKEMHENEKIIWADLDESDLVAKRVDDCILKMEKYCWSIMKK